MPNRPIEIKPKYYPMKPDEKDEFKEAVAWFGGRELIASLKGTLMYMIYGENMDPRAWMKPNVFPELEENVKLKPTVIKEKEDELKEKLGEFAKSNAVYDTQFTDEIKQSDEFKEEISISANQFWKKMIFDYWQWKYENFGFWQKYLDKQPFWKNLIEENKEKEENQEKEGKKEKEIEEFWFDFIADTGDGQLGVYGVACMCFSDLWLESEKVGATISLEPPDIENTGKKKKSDKPAPVLLPRGYFLFVGGDTAYHTANYATLFERFQTPFLWAFASVRKYLVDKYDHRFNIQKSEFFYDGKLRKIFDNASGLPLKLWDGTVYKLINDKIYVDTEPLRPIFGIPANHDYYDNIEGFNKQFRRSPFENAKENIDYQMEKGGFILSIPTFSREQEASYVAIRLPFDWWMLGIDSENEKLDFRQEVFFKQIIKDFQPSKIILATPEPTTVFGKKCDKEDKTAVYFENITKSFGLQQPFLNDGEFIVDPDAESHIGEICRLDLSGDVHHYARYWGENTNPKLQGKFSAENYASVVAGGGGAFFDSTSTLIGEQTIGTEKIKGDIPPQHLYPSPDESIEKTADRIFNLRNIRKGGYIQWAGMIGAILFFFLLTQYSNVALKFNEFFSGAAAQSVSNNSNPNPDTYRFFFSENPRQISLVIVIFCLGYAAYSLKSLIKEIKKAAFQNKESQFQLIRIKKLLSTTKTFFVGVFVYLGYLFANYYSPIITRYSQLQNAGLVVEDQVKISEFHNSLFLLFHLIIAGLLIWSSAEYTNWLPVRFSVKRKRDVNDYLEKIAKTNQPNESDTIKLLRKTFRESSYQYLPANLLVLFAAAVLIFGIAMFGRQQLGIIVADIAFIILVVGGLLIYIKVLAISTGAQYHDRKGKVVFFLIGSWHAILQLLTPFVIFYYSNLIGLIALGVLWYLFRGNKILRNKSKSRLISGWILIGSLFFIFPYFSTKFFSSFPSFYAVIMENQNNFALLNKESSWIPYIISFLIVGLLGYFLSQIWFSWYLAASLLFDGHNNEVGGLARIQDYKHILRIKVQKDKLTVYVIGFDSAEADVEQLKFKLVDRFEIKHTKI